MSQESYIIGITGHRHLQSTSLPHYREQLRLLLIKLQHKHQSVHILSALSDGADRLIIEEALKCNCTFSAILPMPSSIYEKDFTTPSVLQFYTLLRKAKSIITIPSTQTCNPELQYEKCGHYISDHCSALVSLWDGKRIGLQGGTGEIIHYHLSKTHSILYDLRVSRQDDISDIKAQFKEIKLNT